MSYKIEYNKSEKIIEVKIVGNFDLSTMQEIIPQVANLADESDCFLWLNDYTEAVSKFTYSQIYELSKTLNDTANSLSVVPCKIKRALVTTMDKEILEFAKTVFKNQGLTMEVFENNEDAKKWLKNSEITN